MTSVKKIRQSFLDFFKSQGHNVVPSSSLVPRNDPSLMFTNAGMVQFKDYFTGSSKPYSLRAATTQKCVRAGGKHNDLENVGYTARHHTFFEMLGNFSFGDYFKEEAIDFAWRLITKEWGLNPNKLLVTVYDQDQDAALLWKRISGFSDDKIIRISTSDNFWSMGDTGPCGPCSEIFYDHGEHIFGGPPGSENQDGDRFTEIWNLVFMQFEQKSNGERISLPKPSIDTGMGLERIASVLQGKHNNYDIDLFEHLIQTSLDLTGASSPDLMSSHRVIVDHLRSSSFLIADGVMPSNEGRGYVLRRIMRRAMRHVYLLGYKDLLLHQLVPSLIQEMGETYPELLRAQSLITQTLKLEESRFRETLGRGMQLLSQESQNLTQGSILKGEIAFKLYDTYGFPLDLTQDVLKSKNITVDVKSFEESMEKQRQDARRSWIGSGENQTEEVWYELKEKFGSTEFLGYDIEKAQGLIQAVGKDADQIYIIANQTPFYAESGGQMGDTGIITTATGSFLVADTIKKLGCLHIHYGQYINGTINVGQSATFEVDESRRRSIRANHSATHLLHKGLRDVLGDHVTQKGSLVAPDRLRFDFSHSVPLTSQEIKTVEDCVNKMILENDISSTKIMKPEEAVQAGAMALFGEKYGEEVRVVTMGDSIELCGGTHVKSTGEIGMFKIISESSVSSGIRRIEAITSLKTLDYLRENDELLTKITNMFKTNKRDILAKIQGIIDESKNLEKQISLLKMKAAGSVDLDKKQIKEITFFSKVVEDLPASQMRSLFDELRVKNGIGIYALAGIELGKVFLLIGVSPELTQNFDAVSLAKGCVEAIGGKGSGGRKDFAQAGGTDPKGLSKAFALIEAMIQG